VVRDRRCKLIPRESQDKISEDAQIAISTVTIADGHGEREAPNDDTRRTRWYGQAPWRQSVHQRAPMHGAWLRRQRRTT